MSLKNSGHFVELEAVPKFDEHTPANAVFDKLNHISRGAFLMNFDGKQEFIDVEMLAMAIENRNYLDEVDFETESIHELVRKVSAKNVRIPISSKHVTTQARLSPLQRGGDRLYVVEEDDETVGYILNHETAQKALTTPIVWICGNPRGVHLNSSPGNGWCRHRCKYKIVGSRRAF